MDECISKSERLLIIYSQLVNGAVLSKKALSDHFGVAPRSIQRDIESLRSFFSDQGLDQNIVFDRVEGGYRLEAPGHSMLTDNELYAVCRILLSSQSMPKREMFPLVDKLVDHCSSQISRHPMSQFVQAEKNFYQEPHHQRDILPNLWELAQAANSNHRLELLYDRVNPCYLVKRMVEPICLLFSQYYFYLVVFLTDADWKLLFPHEKNMFPVVYQVDRIRSFEQLPETFRPRLRNTSEEHALRQRFQFMVSGELRRIRFCYSGPFLNQILDRFPTARVLSKDKNGVVIEAETFGGGAEQWLQSQHNCVHHLQSEHLPYKIQL